MRSDFAQVQPAFDADEPLGNSIDGDLLLSVRSSQMAEMLDDRRLAAFKICKPPFHLAKCPLDVGEIGADRTKLRKDKVFRTIDHVSP